MNDEFNFLYWGSIYNKETGTIPTLFHGNGRCPMDKIIELI